jgi:hypothetical protein
MRACNLDQRSARAEIFGPGPARFQHSNFRPRPARYILGICYTGYCKLLTVAKSCFGEKRPGPFFNTKFTARPVRAGPTGRPPMQTSDLDGVLRARQIFLLFSSNDCPRYIISSLKVFNCSIWCVFYQSSLHFHSYETS